MLVRMTNSRTIDTEDIKSVTYSRAQDLYSVQFYNGTGTRYRSVQLTEEGKAVLDKAAGI